VSSIIVGALHDTGDEGVTRKSVMRTVDAVPPAEAGGAGAVVVVGALGAAVVVVVETGVVDGAELVELAGTDVAVVVVVEDEEP
jgi:hypothetical protein